MLRRLSTIFLLGGGAALAWSAGIWGSTFLFGKYEAWRWNARYSEIYRPPVPTTSVKETHSAVNETQPAGAIARPKPHDVIAWLDIPRLGISTPVLEGDDDFALRFGAGHILGTALPGRTGNVGIAAHRDSFFRLLGGIKPQDTLRLRTPGADWEYIVESTRVVQPSNVSVLAASREPELTLVTCYPFKYVGPAPLRFIVHARRTRTMPTAPPKPDLLDVTQVHS
jgi:sortase A